MDILFLLLFLLTPVAMVVFLFKPALLSKYTKLDLSRKKMASYFGILTIVFFVLFGVTTDTTSVKQDQDENAQESAQVHENPEVKGEGTEIESLQQDQQETTDAEGVKVTRVIDGDTIEIEGGARVRYIGIDTPETVAPTSTIQCYGKEASNKNRELVEGKQVKLEKDVSETDRYGRLLRYVYVGDTFLNDYLVRQGFASAFSYPPDVKNQSQFTEAQTEARNNNRGLWGACSGSGLTQPKAITQPTTPQSGNCDQSYPTVCIPPAPPDLDCSDISYRRFKVVAPDPHNFDGDHDGVGCESL